MNSLEARKKEPFLDVIRGRNFLSLLPQHGTSESRNSIRSTSRTQDTNCSIVDKISSRAKLISSRHNMPGKVFIDREATSDFDREFSFSPSTLAKVTPDAQVCLVPIHPKEVHTACHRNTK